MARIESRRRVLQQGGFALAVTLSGCISSLDSNSSSSSECAERNMVVLEAKSIDRLPDERQFPEPLVFSNLSPKQQEIVRTAINGNRYEECYYDIDAAEQEAVNSLGGQGCYLKRGDEYYELIGRVLDNNIC